MKKINATYSFLLAVILFTGILTACDKTVNESSGDYGAIENTADLSKSLVASDSVIDADEEDRNLSIDTADYEVSHSDEASSSYESIYFSDEDYEEAEAEAADFAEKYVVSEDGVYDSKDEVALYIHIYDKLPSNYITKKEAKALGWQGGGLEDFAPGKCIGGDYFGNYEGNLPEEEGREYHECDIDTLGKSKRGAKRIIYSNDGYIYYTEDHYESFELLYGED